MIRGSLEGTYISRLSPQLLVIKNSDQKQVLVLKDRHDSREFFSWRIAALLPFNSGMVPSNASSSLLNLGKHMWCGLVLSGSWYEMHQVGAAATSTAKNDRRYV